MWRDRKSGGEVVSSTRSFGAVTLLVHQSPYKKGWFATSSPLFLGVRLASPDLDQAKAQASAKLHVVLQDALDALIAEKPKPERLERIDKLLAE